MKRGEVWLVSLDPTVGAEIKKTRTAVIVSDDAVGILPLKVIVPITEWENAFANFPWHVKLDPVRETCLRKMSSADTFQVRSISQKRFRKRLGKLSDSIMEAITKALAITLDIDL